jgi:hypothetical protein
MRAYIEPLYRLAPYGGLALLGIFGLLDTTVMIVMTVVLMTTTSRSCLPLRRA